MVTVAFIPARAGSKGVKRKNVRLVGGRPLIEYTIEAALKSERVTHVVVTTNCPDTKEIAAKYPVIVVDRPDNLAEDETPTFPVIEHAVQVLRDKHGITPDIVLLLQCTSPMREPRHVDEALALFDDANVKAVTSVMQVGDEHPARMYRIGDDHRLAPLDPELERLRRQDLPVLYRRNGAVYALRLPEFESQKTLIARDATPYVMPGEVSINIDTETDLLLADILLSRQGK